MANYDPILRTEQQIFGDITVASARNQFAPPGATPRSIQRSAYDPTNPGGGNFNLDYTATAYYSDENFWSVPAVPRSPTRIMASPILRNDNFDGAKLAYYPLALRYGQQGVRGGRQQ